MRAHALRHPPYRSHPAVHCAQCPLARTGLECDLTAPSERDRINEMIFQELVKGVLRTDSRAEVRAIGQLGEKGCDAVIIGCTELPLLSATGVPWRSCRGASRRGSNASRR